MSHISNLYKPDFGLLTDLYQLTMAYGYWQSGLYTRDAVFHLFYRENPFGNKFTVVAGLELAVDFLKKFNFSPEDIQYLGGLKGRDGQSLFNESFLNHLQRMEFSCDIDAMPEGSIAFPNQPLVRVRGPLMQAQLIETALLNIINFSTLIATKSARIVKAADGDKVLEFGLRRAQGIDGGITASRAAYIGGCHATSNVLAGKYYGIPVKGTHAHSWVMCFDEEITSFREYARAMPNNCIFLVDTYNTIDGVKNAIRVSRELRDDGHEVVGIRLDSGDLAELSIEARRLLDEAGFEKTAIVASNNLDEHQIKALKDRGAKISIWGVGTRMATAYDEPALGGVYKLSAIQEENGDWDYRLKLSEQKIKISNPGVLQIRRFFDDEGQPVADQLFNIHNSNLQNDIFKYGSGEKISFHPHRSENLLRPVFRNGNLIYNLPVINEIRKFSIEQQKLFEPVDPEEFVFGLEPELYKLKSMLIDKHQDAVHASE